MDTAPRIPIANGAAVPLPSYVWPNMPVGFIVADESGQDWRLSVSTDPVNHTSVEACAGNAHLRWLVVPARGQVAETQGAPQ